jgi:hypothetical protein
MSEQAVQALLVRAFKTFVQAFLSVFLVGITPILTNITSVGYSGAKAALVALVTGAIAAGISALMNAFLKPVEAK